MDKVQEALLLATSLLSLLEQRLLLEEMQPNPSPSSIIFV